MKKTVLEHLNGLPPDAKEMALNNLDARYSDELVYDTDYAIMLGVCQNTESDKKFWRDYKNTQLDAKYPLKKVV